MEDISKSLVSYEISDEEEIDFEENKIKFRKKS